MQKSPRAAGVDDETCADADGPAFALAIQNRVVAVVRQALEPRHVEVFRTGALRLLGQRLIELRPVPVRVGDRIVRAGGNEQLPLVIVGVGELLSRLVKEKGEAALEAAGDLGAKPLP